MIIRLIIGMEKSGPISRFVTKLPGPRLEPASGPGTVCGVYVVTNDKTGLATSIEPIRVGGRLAEHHQRRFKYSLAAHKTATIRN